MNISALQQIASMYSTTSVNSTAQKSQDTQTLAEILKALCGDEDSLSISRDGLIRSKMPPPPPPQEMDFANMSDEDLTEYLQKMQEMTGFIPGVDSEASASELTSEQLQSIRELLADMQARMSQGMHGMGKMQGPPPGPPPADVQSMSEDNLKLLLEEIQERTGSIPGVEDSESMSVSELTSEQLQSARDALAEMVQKWIDEMMQSRAMHSAASAYETNISQAL